MTPAATALRPWSSRQDCNQPATWYARGSLSCQEPIAGGRTQMSAAALSSEASAPTTDDDRKLDAIQRRLVADRARTSFQRLLFTIALLLFLLGSFFVIFPDPLTSFFMDRYPRDPSKWVAENNRYTIFFGGLLVIFSLSCLAYLYTDGFFVTRKESQETTSQLMPSLNDDLIKLL